MITLREAAQQALEALEQLVVERSHEAMDAGNDAITAIKAALEQPEQEPPALFTKYGPPTMRDRDFWSAGYAAATARAIEAALKERNA